MNPNKIVSSPENKETPEYTFTKEMIKEQREKEIEERGHRAFLDLQKKGAKINKRTLDKQYDSIKLSEQIDFGHYGYKSFLESMPKNKNDTPLTQEDKIEMGLLEIINKEGGEGALFDKLVSSYMPKGVEYERRTKASSVDSDKTYEGVEFHLSPSKTVKIWGDGSLSMNTHKEEVYSGGSRRGLNPSRVVLGMGRLRRDVYQDPSGNVFDREEEYTFNLEEDNLLVTKHYVRKSQYGWVERGGEKSEWVDYDLEWDMEFEGGSPIATIEVREYYRWFGEPSIHRAYGLRNGEVFMEKSQAMEAKYKEEKNKAWANRVKKILNW